ncbi:MAG: ArsR family transcriptional regulator [Haloferacaceae archaeon]
MDSGVLLNLLGNENRRRILRLLSRKPCYVTEISEYLGVSPKAVIDHLRKLEEAGLIESHTDDQRRKYFHITRGLRLEVNVSPHGFDTKSGYPANPGLELNGRCPHIKLNVQTHDNPEDVADLAGEFDQLEDLEHELSLAQRWVHGRMVQLLDRLSDTIGADGDSRFYAEVLAAIAGGDRGLEAIASTVGAPPDVVEDALQSLNDRGLVDRDGDEWRLE